MWNIKERPPQGEMGRHLVDVRVTKKVKHLRIDS